MIYTGKTSYSLPTAEFPEGSLLRSNKSHWSNAEGTLCLLKEVISPYITKVEKKTTLRQNQIACLIWDAFNTQSTENVEPELEHLNIKDVKIPKNMTHLLQPLDLTTNRVIEKMEQRKFSHYFTKCITKALLDDPKRGVTTIKVDLKIPTLKPIRAKTVSKVYRHLKSNKGKQVILNGFRGAGITEAVRKIQENSKSIIELILLC